MVFEQVEILQELCFLTLFLELLGHIQIPLLLIEFFPLTLLSFKWGFLMSVSHFCWSCHPPRDVAEDFNLLCCKLWNIFSSLLEIITR